MTVARSEIVDVSVSAWYHVVSKVVRGSHLLGEGPTDRKQWIEDRLRELADVFAIEVAGFAVLDSHLHLLVRLSPERAAEWSDQAVVRHWGSLFPPRGKDRKPLPVSDQWVQQKLKDQQFVQTRRQRLANLGWFMKCLKEPLARMANRQDGCEGAFWQGRYKSIAILDEEALLATCAYIDLNPLAAGLAKLPEDSPHTSVRLRVEHCRTQGRLADLQTARQGSVLAARASRAMERGHWLCPLEDRRNQGSRRPGLLEGFSLGSYLQLVDWTSRQVRHGKARVGLNVPSILDRLGTSAEIWQTMMSKLFAGRALGVSFSFHREHLRQAATQRGRHHVANLNGCPA